MHIIAATFLLPVGVTVYTFVGGIKATSVLSFGDSLSPLLTHHSFLTDYFHTAIILIIACYFTAKAFSVDQVGSVGNLYELLVAAAERHPVSGNQGGTYLTMKSKSVSNVMYGNTMVVDSF
jgi:Na+/proline symporter